MQLSLFITIYIVTQQYIANSYRRLSILVCVPEVVNQLVRFPYSVASSGWCLHSTGYKYYRTIFSHPMVDLC